MSDGLDAQLFRSFADTIVDRIRGPFLAQHPPRAVLRFLETAFRFALERRQGELHVAVTEGGRGLVIQTHMDDQPFIVDTTRLYLKRHGAEYWGGFHVIVRVRRDAEGRLLAVGDDEPLQEALALMEVGEGDLLSGTLDHAASLLREHLTMARLAVGDFRIMTRTVDRFRERCESLADRRPEQAEIWNETANFLAWLNRENFVFMGMHADGNVYGIETVDGPYRASPADAPWKATHPPGTVFVRKSNTESPIHRAGRIDEVRVVVGEGDDATELFVRGLFTYRAVTQPSRNVPILTRVLKAELERQGAVPGSFRYKGIGNVFDSLPTEFLFVTPASAISEMIELVLDSEQQQEVGVTLLRYEDGSAFCLLTMPKEQYSDELRREIELEMERALGATYADHGLFIGRFDTVLLHYFLTGVAAAEDEAVQALTERIRSLATPWESALWQVVARDHGDERADQLVDRFGRGFPAEWRRRTSAERAAADLIFLDQLSDDRILADVFEEDGVAKLRVFQSRDANLTDILPVLGNFGLTVIRSEAVQIAALGGARHIDTFDLAFDEDGKERFFARRDLFTAALPQVFARVIENDPLNALVIQSGLAWDQVDVLRGYVHYLRQLQFSLPAPRVRSILLTHPITCGALYQLFDARFRVDVADRDAAVAAAESELADLMRLIQTHDEDQALNAVAGLIRATLRTNHFRTDRVSHYLSFKFECARIREMKPEKPLFEIYVHSREVEGVHLRFGKVARGGLRWSDRADYRTEVLGLVTTQQVKNVVIVPEGSKGGFYLHYPDPDRGVQRAQADRLYRVFIRGLLDLTDNVKDGAQLRPPGVVCHDAFDPYLVVAADKGTAHLSDTANSLSEAYGFWLGDAFASGGSNGYDHKKVGITARGGWVLVKRHFAEMGKDPYRETITAIGVGDMSGDVFGNGLIETPHIKLLAAFNHIHIFLDPDPDPQRSFDERLRLFRAERNGGWNNYDRSVISAGGGVYDRTAKSIPLSPEAAAMLGLPGDAADPEAVISAILKLDVDLFWSGGIGTYVKATRESQEDADDRTNDRCRVNASDLRCRVVGEGANLSFTQAARIEAGLRGIRLNTDFIDNSAGVDLSDHEVNLKILLSAAVTRGELSQEDRNRLLVDLTDEVARLVLVDNDTQGRQISRDRLRSSADIFPFGRAIAFIERHFHRTRASFQLPSDELLAERAEAGLGLTRPELSTLSAHVKRFVYAELLASGQARQLTGYKSLLTTYFPAQIQGAYRKDIENHQLADEIAMTGATTRVVGDAGAAFVPLAVESTGRSVFAVVDTYLRAQKLARAGEVRATLEELRASVRLEALTRAWVQVDAGCKDVAMFWLSSGTRPPTDAELEEMAQAVHEVYALQADDVARRNAAMVEKMRGDDIPEAVARRVMEAQYLNIALMVWWHAKKLGISFRETVIRELAAGRASRLQEIIEALGRRPTSGQWEPIAMRVLVNRFTDRLRQLVLKVGTALPAHSVDELEPLLVAGPLADVRAQVDRLLPKGGPIDLPALIVLEERLDGAIRRIGG